MTDEIKEAYNFAQKEIEKEKQEALRLKVKDIVRSTLEKIDKIDKEEKELAEKKKILKKDIDDLKAGRLDLIEERQKESELARNTSVFKVILKEIHYPPQCNIYTITPSYSYDSNAFGNLTTTCLSTSGVTTNCEASTITGWATSNCVSGTYNIDGIIKYL